MVLHMKSDTGKLTPIAFAFCALTGVAIAGGLFVLSKVMAFPLDVVAFGLLMFVLGRYGTRLIRIFNRRPPAETQTP